MTISNEAVEAAKAGIRAHAHIDWQAEHLVEGLARAALEAAAGIIRAEALTDAAEDFEGNVGVGEFAEQSIRDGAYWLHIQESWDHQGPYMDWLRARAVAERGRQ